MLYSVVLKLRVAVVSEIYDRNLFIVFHNQFSAVANVEVRNELNSTHHPIGIVYIFLLPF